MSQRRKNILLALALLGVALFFYIVSFFEMAAR